MPGVVGVEGEENIFPIPEGIKSSSTGVGE